MLFTAALQLVDPWHVTDVELRDTDAGGREPRITIGYGPGSRFHCPEAICLDWLQCIRQSDEGRMTWDWRPTMAGPKHPRHYDEAFKRQIVQSCESGKPSREIRAEYDIARSTPRRWVQGIRDSGSTRAADNRTPGRNEPIEPGRRNRQLEMEVDVSEQAAPVFARR